MQPKRRVKMQDFAYLLVARMENWVSVPSPDILSTLLDPEFLQGTAIPRISSNCQTERGRLDA